MRFWEVAKSVLFCEIQRHNRFHLTDFANAAGENLKKEHMSKEIGVLL